MSTMTASDEKSARRSVQKESPNASSATEESVLFECVPDSWIGWHPTLLHILGWAYLIIFSLSFLVLPISGVIFMIPWVWRTYPLLSFLWFLLLVALTIVPTKEWPAMRCWAELWYQIFKVSVNMSPATRQKYLDMSQTHNFAVCMHPHGIIPFQAVIWAAYCDQYLTDKVNGNKLYGFGAVADVVMQMPFLRSFMGWLSCSGAAYNTLKAGLSKGICESVNKAGRTPRHLFILPGGIAEIFTSTPGKNIIIFKKRKGLITLALETGALLIPCYVFGASDIFHNFSTGEGFLSKMGRKYRVGVTMFFGYLGLPIPFSPRLTMCFADPLPVEKWVGEGPVPPELVDKLHSTYILALQNLFEKYKVAAGYPDAELEVR